MKLIAHGGYSAKYPENTYESYINALDFTPDGIEMDVVFYNGEFYCYHPVGNMTSYGDDVDLIMEKELGLKIENGDQVPKLFELIPKLLDGTGFIQADLKQKSNKYLDHFITEIQKLNLDKEQIVVGARDFEKMEKLMKFDSALTLLGLMPNPEDFIEFSENGGKIYRLFEEYVTEEVIQRIHDVGLEVWITLGHRQTPTQPRTAGEVSPKRLLEFRDIGVDGVLVNDIEEAIKVLRVD